MQKKIMLLIIVVLIIIVMLILITNPLLRTDKRIRENLFKELPMGTKMEDVIKYIEDKEEWEVDWILYDRGFYYSAQRNGPIKGKSREIGEKNIRANMGSFRIIFVTDVVVHFGFDEESKLIEIWVRKDTDSL